MTALPATSDAGRARVPAGRAIRLLVVLAILVGIGWLAVDRLGTEQATEQFVNALTRGPIYALIAIGYTMVYGIIELINFAHGDMFMVGAFISLLVSHVARLHRGHHRHPPADRGAGRHLRRHDGSPGHPRRRDRALRLQAAAQRTAPGPADHGDRRVVHPAERRPAVLRPVPDQLAEDLPGHLDHRGRRGERSRC